MIVDSSAIIAVLRRESDRDLYRVALSGAVRPRMSAATFVETSIVAGPTRHEDVDGLLEGVEIVAFDRAQAVVARRAYVRYGKGSGSPARLNYGDCMAYALAVTLDEPLLFKGDDFTHTDVRSALG